MTAGSVLLILLAICEGAHASGLDAGKIFNAYRGATLSQLRGMPRERREAALRAEASGALSDGAEGVEGLWLAEGRRSFQAILDQLDPKGREAFEKSKREFLASELRMDQKNEKAEKKLDKKERKWTSLQPKRLIKIDDISSFAVDPNDPQRFLIGSGLDFDEGTDTRLEIVQVGSANPAAAKALHWGKAYFHSDISPDGTRAVAGIYNRSDLNGYMLFDLASGKKLGSGVWGGGVQFVDGADRLLLTQTYDSQQLVDVSNPKKPRVIRKIEAGVSFVSPDRSEIWRFTRDKRRPEIEIYSSRSGRTVRRFELKSRKIDEKSRFALSPDRTMLAHLSQGRLEIFDANSGALKSRASVASREEAKFVTFTPDGKRLVACDLQGGVWVYDMVGETPRVADVAKHRLDGFDDIKLSDDGKKLYVGHKSGLYEFDLSGNL